MKKAGKLGSEKGFTLLETLLALSIVSMTAVFFGSFLIPQMKFYYDYDRRTQAKAMCSEAYVKLEEILRYGYMYSCNPANSEKLSYYTREEGPETQKDRERGGNGPLESNTWPVLSAEDLDISSGRRMSLKLNFEGTTQREVKVKIQAVLDEEVVYEQDAVIHSLYGYER